MVKDKSIADPLKAITSYNNLLTDRGITLYLLPVPPKALIYPDKLAVDLSYQNTSDEIARYQRFPTTSQPL